MTRLPTLTPRGSALFLDFDGTLTELAERPDAVQTAADLPDTIDRLHRGLGGALAIVTGRAREDLARWLPVHRWPGAFEHGALRHSADGVEHRPAWPFLSDLVPMAAQARAFAERHPGVLLEVKHTSLALHYRLAPTLGPACEAALTDLLVDRAGWQLMRGKAVVEMRPAHAGKGAAIAAFLAEAPFAGRVPVFAGDDVTDEDGFAAVQQAGGLGIKVGDGPSGARLRCPDPSALRSWLTRALESLA